ncbi:MAG: 50S ribosomal protein L4 [Myxococcales bacterium]|nr:50S ribosomal protein L4 [Myxococcales bacterium]
MPKVKVYDLDRNDVGELELSDQVFDATVNEALFYDVLKAQLASRRSGSAKVKNRAEVAGSSRKVYRQKGTGNARHGSIRAPLYVGGGQAHGPRPRSYAYRPPRKMRVGALRSALSMKLKEGHLLILEAFDMPEVKTRKLERVLEKLKVDSGAVIVDAVDNQTLRLSARNMNDHLFLPPEGVNLYDLLRHEHLVLTKKAVAALEQRCSGRASLDAPLEK